MWQMVLIYVMVIAAFFYVVWFLFIPGRKRDKCSSCSREKSCSVNNKERQP
jgi:hypothetical protein